MSYTADLTPDFARLYRTFEREARQRAEYIGHELGSALAVPGDDAESHLQRKLGALHVMRGVLQPLAVCSQAATTVDAMLEFRELLADVLAEVVGQTDRLERHIGEVYDAPEERKSSRDETAELAGILRDLVDHTCGESDGGESDGSVYVSGWIDKQLLAPEEEEEEEAE